MDWQLCLILAAVTGLASWIIWDAVAPLIRRDSND